MGNSASGNSSISYYKYPSADILQYAIAERAKPKFQLVSESIIFYSIWEISEQDFNDYNGTQTNSPVDAGEQLPGSDQGEVQSDIKVQQGSDGKGDGSDDAKDRSGSDRAATKPDWDWSPDDESQ
jgi:hypothetical protein